MPRVCTVCAHEEREAIDHALVAGVSLRDVARRHGVTKDALHRHKQAHLSAAVVAIRTEQEHEHGATLLEQVRGLQREALSILESAKQSGRPTVALSAIREASRLLELCGRLTGELDERPSTTVNMLVAPEWLTIRAAMLGALTPYPEARAAVAGRLQELEAPR